MSLRNTFQSKLNCSSKVVGSQEDVFSGEEVFLLAMYQSSKQTSTVRLLFCFFTDDGNCGLCLWLFNNYVPKVSLQQSLVLLYQSWIFQPCAFSYDGLQLNNWLACCFTWRYCFQQALRAYWWWWCRRLNQNRKGRLAEGACASTFWDFLWGVEKSSKWLGLF